jgi:hypothetical protein
LFVGKLVSDGEVCDGDLIQIQFKRVNIVWPVPEGLTSSWTPAQWWYCLLKYPDQFTKEEMQRCHEIGMPDEVTKGPERLNPDFWNPESGGMTWIASTGRKWKIHRSNPSRRRGQNAPASGA